MLWDAWLDEAAKGEANTFFACLHSERDRFHKQVRPSLKMTIDGDWSGGSVAFGGLEAAFLFANRSIIIRRSTERVDLREFEFGVRPHNGDMQLLKNAIGEAQTFENTVNLYAGFWRSRQTSKEMSSLELAFFCVGRVLLAT